MWSSGGSDNNQYYNKNCFLISSISSSTSSSSSPSPFSNPKSMEEVWNDITLSSLPASHGLQDLHFNQQDFLAPPNTNLPSSTATYGSPPPHPDTVLSLNPGLDFHFEPQAYTNELIIKLEILRAENDRLKKSKQQLYVAASAQAPQNHTLQRTSSAPF